MKVLAYLFLFLLLTVSSLEASSNYAHPEKEIVLDLQQVEQLLKGYEQIKIGMDKSEVIDILGEPHPNNVSESEGASGKLEWISYEYIPKPGASVKGIHITINNGKVTDKSK